MNRNITMMMMLTIPPASRTTTATVRRIPHQGRPASVGQYCSYLIDLPENIYVGDICFKYLKMTVYAN